MRYLIRPLDLKGVNKLVYEAIYENIYDFDNMQSKYTYRQIAEDIRLEFKLEYNPKQIMLSINKLVESGYLQVVEKGKKGSPTTFKIVKIEEVKRKQIDYKLETDRQQIDVEIPILTEDIETDKQQIGNRLATPYNKKKKKSNIYIDLIEAYTKNNDLVEAINDFISMRGKIKKPVTERALKGILNKLDKFANDDIEKIEILENSIEHCWIGVFELKNKKAPIAVGTNENKKSNYSSSICKNDNTNTEKIKFINNFQ